MRGTVGNGVWGLEVEEAMDGRRSRYQNGQSPHNLGGDVTKISKISVSKIQKQLTYKLLELNPIFFGTPMNTL